MAEIKRHQIRVTGVVQGVGFRPFVFGLAKQFKLSGFVGNDSRGVFIEVEGPPNALAWFQQALVGNPPPLAHIDSVTVNTLAPQGSTEFRIVASVVEAGAATLVSPDLCTCDDCLRELLDPADRRYRYPFINCTNCGPRFTIIRELPYDRPGTTMVDFPMCDRCEAEYHDPLDRRFHAQPNACPDCGPQVSFSGILTHDDPVQSAQIALRQGRIVAVKGLGGFHLACDAANDGAVNRLRERKRREQKPFAVMVADLDAARALAHINQDEEAQLTSRQRPIVLLRKRDATAWDSVTGPHNPTIGVMLPYTPLHTLLLYGLSTPLVMTSGNHSGEPIIIDNDDALQKLGDIADDFLLHNRDIHAPCDDSVIRVLGSDVLPIRRSRGYAPFPVKLPFDVPQLVAVGGELKNTFCITRERHAFMSQHIGDMENLETLAAFESAFDHFRHLYNVRPELVVNDRHPGYLSTRWAERYADERGLPRLAVQHHHAHIAGVMAENGIDETEAVIGFSFDGTGYGDDGAIWGGEVMLATYADFKRAAHLAYVPLAGGDLSVKRPYRMALAHLWAAGITWSDDIPAVRQCPESERRILHQQLEKSLNTVPTSSMGRLFDAVAALIGLRGIAHYEAQAAIELEGIAVDADGRYDFKVSNGAIDPAPVLRDMLIDMRGRTPPEVMAGRFHEAVARLMLDLSRDLRASTGLETVALSGGVFQNVRLVRLAEHLLEAAGFRVLRHRQVPPNDAGLALGQAMSAAARINKGDPG